MVPSLDFSTTTWRSAYAATCGRWVTTSTWAVLASSASRRPTSTAARPPTPASTSSNTNVGTGTGAGERHLDGQHHPGQLATRGSLGERARGRTGVGGQLELHLVDPGRAEPHPALADEQRAGGLGGSASCWRTTTVTRPSGMASWVSSSDTCPASRPAAACGRRSARRPRQPRSARSRGGLLPQPLDPAVGVVEVERAGADDCSAQPSTSSMVSPYLRVSAVSAARRSETRRQPRGVGLEPRGVRRHVGRQVGQQVGELGQPVGELAGLRVVVADGVERRARLGGRRQRVGGRPGRSTAPRGPARRRPAACRRSPAGPPRPPGRCPHPVAAPRPRSRRARTAAGRPHGPARGRPA